MYYEPLSAEEAVEEGQLEDAQVLIVDPPRKSDGCVMPSDCNTRDCE